MLDHDRRPHQEIRILGIDPGTDTVGLGLVCVDPITLKITVRKAVTLRGSLLETPYLDSVVTKNDRDTRLFGIRDRFESIITEWDPHLFFCEDNFLGRNPQSFKGLIEAVFIMKHIANKVCPFSTFREIPPMVGKALIGATKSAGDKDFIRIKLLQYQKLNWDPMVDISEVTEHAFDGILQGLVGAVGVVEMLLKSQWR